MCEGAGVNGAWELGGFQDAPEELRELRGLGAGCWRLEAGDKHHHPRAPVLPQTTMATHMYSCQIPWVEGTLRNLSLTGERSRLRREV